MAALGVLVVIMNIIKFLYEEDGRLGRLGYTFGSIFIAFIGVVSIQIILLIPSSTAQSLMIILVMVIYGLALRSITVRRCHDFGKTIWGSFWRDQIPIVGMLWASVELFFKPGDPMENKYGHVPPL